MALNGIDISNWQSGINLAVVPCDFVVIKATEGTGYVNPDYERAYRQAKTAGKCLGIYHYASGGNIQAEAEYFLKNAGSRVGEAMLVLDWEGRSNPAFGVNDREWVKAWCNYISTKTSVNPVVYVQQSMMSRLQNIGNYGLWVAQYASMEPIGYQENPWNEGAYACVMRQYSSSGRLSGWNGNLDLNKFYGDRQAWMLEKETRQLQRNLLKRKKTRKELRWIWFFGRCVENLEMGKNGKAGLEPDMEKCRG